jgi:hypothetical protein
MTWPVVVAAAGAQPWINPRGSPRAGRGCCGADAGVAQLLEPCPDMTSRPVVQALVHPKNLVSCDFVKPMDAITSP